MLYNLVKKSTGEIEFSNLTAISLAEIKLNMTLYRLEAVKDGELKQKQLSELSIKEESRLFEEFKSTLTNAQHNDVHCGIKKIEWKSGIGFFLKVIGNRDKQEEIHVSIESQNIKRKEKIETLIKKSILSLESELYHLVKIENIDMSMAEFSQAFNKLIKK